MGAPRSVPKARPAPRGGSNPAAEPLAPNDGLVELDWNGRRIAIEHAWHRPERIWELASIAVAGRPGQAETLAPDLQSRRSPAWSGRPGELVLLPSTGLQLSSSTLREQLGRGETPDGLPPQVLAAILAENLYR